MEDSRIVDRRRCHLRAQIMLTETAAAMSCSVEDLSAKGAKLTLSMPMALPSELILVMPWRGGERTWIRKRWQDGASVGVEFAPADCIDSVKLLKLVEENAELKETLKRSSARLAALGQRAVPVEPYRRQISY